MRIAPPEAPKTGYLYGKGAYFADYIGKSAPYCRYHDSNGVGLLLLCQVALGTPAERKHCDSNVDDFVKKSKKFDSCHAIGTSITDPKQSKFIKEKNEQFEVPYGKP